MSKLLHLRPGLRTDGVRTTINRYGQTLGFVKTIYNDERVWGEEEKGDAAIVFSNPPIHEPFDGPQFTGSLYIVTDDTDALWETAEKSLQVYYALQTFTYVMRGFAVRDYNGYILQFGQQAVA